MPIFAGASHISKVSFASGAHQIVATIYQEGQGFGETDVLTFRLSTGGKLLKTMDSDRFEMPVLFHYNRENFIHVSTVPAGSGAFVTDTIFWIAPDATMHEIEIESAAETYGKKVNAEETVLTGASSVNCSGGKLKFQFYIANDSDSHCCPTAGKVTGNYKILGQKKFDPITKQYSSTFKMVVKGYSRTPISTGEALAHFAE